MFFVRFSLFVFLCSSRLIFGLQFPASFKSYPPLRSDVSKKTSSLKLYPPLRSDVSKMCKYVFFFFFVVIVQLVFVIYYLAFTYCSFCIQWNFSLLFNQTLQLGRSLFSVFLIIFPSAGLGREPCTRPSPSRRPEVRHTRREHHHQALLGPFGHSLRARQRRRHWGVAEGRLALYVRAEQHEGHRAVLQSCRNAASGYNVRVASNKRGFQSSFATVQYCNGHWLPCARLKPALV